MGASKSKQARAAVERLKLDEGVMNDLPKGANELFVESESVEGLFCRLIARDRHDVVDHVLAHLGEAGDGLSVGARRGVECASHVLKEAEGEVDFRELGLDGDSMQFVCMALGVRRLAESLERVDFSGVRMGKAGAQKLVALLAQMKALRVLCVNDCALSGAEIAALIGETAEWALTVRELHARMNKVSDDEGKAIGDALDLDPCLRVLDLSSNEIMNIGARNIFRGLKNNSRLQRLFLQQNPIDGPGLPAVLDELAENQALQVVDLYNDLGKLVDEHAALAATFLEEQRGNLVLGLGGHRVSEAVRAELEERLDGRLVFERVQMDEED